MLHWSLNSENCAPDIGKLASFMCTTNLIIRLITLLIWAIALALVSICSIFMILFYLPG
ncbi:hypothetical protein LINPERHAP2_LOCUS15679 [Linum perenne]